MDNAIHNNNINQTHTKTQSTITNTSEETKNNNKHIKHKLKTHQTKE